MAPSFRPVFLFAVLSLALTIASPAFSDEVPEQNRVLARSLFEEARKLMAEKRYDEACPKLAESLRLDPAAGTRLNLATCHEAIGKSATAWSEFNDALTEARRDNRPDRIEYAEKHIAALEPQLSRLTVTLAPGARVDGMEIRLDGNIVGPAAWGLATPIDPGAHAVSATAPHRTEWTGDVTVGPNGDRKTIVVPMLEQAPASAPAPAPAAPSPVARAAVVKASPPPRTAPSPPTPRVVTRGSSQRLIALVVGGAGVVALGVGGIVALDAKSKDTTAAGESGAARQADSQSAVREGNAATVVCVVGATMAAAGAVLWVTAPSTKVTLGTNGRAVFVGGAF